MSKSWWEASEDAKRIYERLRDVLRNEDAWQILDEELATIRERYTCGCHVRRSKAAGKK